MFSTAEIIIHQHHSAINVFKVLLLFFILVLMLARFKESPLEIDLKKFKTWDRLQKQSPK